MDQVPSGWLAVFNNIINYFNYHCTRVIDNQLKLNVYMHLARADCKFGNQWCQSPCHLMSTFTYNVNTVNLLTEDEINNKIIYYYF